MKRSSRIRLNKETAEAYWDESVDVLLEQRKSVSLSLDDPLVYFENARLYAMIEILSEAATRVQAAFSSAAIVPSDLALKIGSRCDPEVIYRRYAIIEKQERPKNGGFDGEQM